MTYENCLDAVAKSKGFTNYETMQRMYKNDGMTDVAFNKHITEAATMFAEQSRWVSVDERLPEIGQIVDIWEMPQTNRLKQNVSLRGSEYAELYLHDTDYNGWRSTNYMFTIEKDDEGEMKCFIQCNERYLTPIKGREYKKLIVENGEVTHWQQLPSPPKQQLKAIDELAEKKYSALRSVDSNYGHKVESYKRGMTDMLELIELDEGLLFDFLYDFAIDVREGFQVQFPISVEAKQQILQSLTIKEVTL